MGHLGADTQRSRLILAIFLFFWDWLPWHVLRQSLHVRGRLSVIVFNWTLARRVRRFGSLTPLIEGRAGPMAVALRDVRRRPGLGVQGLVPGSMDQTSKITDLEKVLGDGRRLPVRSGDELGCLRFGRTGGFEGTGDKLNAEGYDFHVLESRATLANAPCGLSTD